MKYYHFLAREAIKVHKELHPKGGCTNRISPAITIALGHLRDDWGVMIALTKKQRQEIQKIVLEELNQTASFSVVTRK